MGQIAKTARINWMDLLRGGAILLVIINHAVLWAGAQTGVPAVVQVFNAAFAPLRMPLMVFLSGMLLASSLRKGHQAYLTGKLRNVLHPYIVWSIIVVAVSGLTDMLEGKPFPAAMFAEVLADPVAHMWFLAYLLTYYMIAMVPAPALAVAAVSVALCAILGGDGGWDRFFLLLAFFMLGKWASDNPHSFERFLANRAVVTISALVSVALVVAAIAGPDLRYQAISAPVVAAAIIVSIRIARACENAPVLAGIRSIGRDSLVYYLAHWYGVIAGVRLADALFDSEPWMVFAGGVIGGMAAGIAFQCAYHHWTPTKLLFSWPRRQKVPTHAA